MGLRVISFLVALAIVAPYARAQADDAEAKKHYRVGLVALENNDLSVAADEFRQASRLAPNNALIDYYLAVVFSKQGKPSDGLEILRKAITLGLPEKEAAAAEDLEAKLTYDLKRRENLTISWLSGSWGVDKRERENGPTCYKDMVRSWRLTVSPSSGSETLRGKLTYRFEATAIPFRPESTSSYCYVREQYVWLHTWDVVVTQSDSPGKAKVEFSYIGCEGVCARSANSWNSWQTVIEKRSENEIFVSGAERPGDASSFSILGRVR